MIKAIIFDMDGVLVDSDPFHIAIEKHQIEVNKVLISDEEHHQYIGVATDVMWYDIAKRYALPIDVEQIITQNKEESILFFNELKEIPLMPGIEDVLKKLTEMNYPMAVASSSFKVIIEIILKKTGLRKYFQHIVSSEEAGKSKPSPDVFLLAAKRLGIDPAECLVVEDSFNGIKAAKSAGMRCIAYQGPGANEAKQREADAVIKSYDKLLSML